MDDLPAPADAAARQSRPRWQGRPVLAGLTAAAAALAVTTGWLAVRAHDGASADQRRAAVLMAARQEALNLTTLDRRDGGREYSAVLAGAAGSLKQQLSAGRSVFLRTLSASDVSSAGAVLDAGVVTISPQAATVLLDVRAVVRNSRTYVPETRVYHWQAHLVRSGGRWLVTSVEFL